MESDRVRALLAEAGGRIARRPGGDDLVSRLQSLRSPSEFRAFLSGVPVVVGSERRRELAIAASGPDWERNRDVLLRAAAVREPLRIGPEG